MPDVRRAVLAVGLLMGLAAAALGEDKCLVKADLGGKAVTLKHCEVAMYDEKGVVLVFLEDPISAEEVAAFQWNSAPKEKDAAGKLRTMIEIGFCPAGGGTAVAPGAVKSVEMSVAHSSSPMLGRQWVFELPKDKDLKIEKLSGKLASGGKLAGRITGAKTSDGLTYSWQADFDVQLPTKAAAAGLSCEGS
jgi:hypothetical protein